MLKVTVLYGPPTDAVAFEAHYANAHMPLVHKIPGLGRIEKTRVVGTPGGGSPPFYRIFEYWFDDRAHMNRVLGSPEARAATDDLKNFATGGTTILIGEVDD
jgi:uncharacterized protein (TIGR02118 family)